MLEAGRVATSTGDLDPRARARARSKALLGNQDRLEVAVAIARSSGDLVHAAGLSRELNMPNNRVRAQLIAFAEAGLLQPLPPDDRIRWYRREPSVFWGLCVPLLEEWAADG